MEERDFFDERSDKKPASLSCPHCHQAGEYEIQWLVRTKKKNMRCRKRFEITGVQSVAFLD
jgi:hypothetical protein